MALLSVDSILLVVCIIHYTCSTAVSGSGIWTELARVNLCLGDLTNLFSELSGKINKVKTCARPMQDAHYFCAGYLNYAIIMNCILYKLSTLHVAVLIPCPICLLLLNIAIHQLSNIWEHVSSTSQCNN